jgi:glycosyltransferase involved in cell wall biosynthesis
MNNKNSFSILIPTHNSSAFLSECLNSVFYQISDDDEVIVIDNNSSDTTSEILNKEVNKHSNLHCVYLHSTISLLESRLLALKEATKDYIVFLDSDDVLMENCLSQLAAGILSFSSPNLLIYRNMYFNESGYIGDSQCFFSSSKPIFLSDEQKKNLLFLFSSSDLVNNVWLKCIKRKALLNSLCFSSSKFTYVEDRVLTSMIFSTCFSSIVYMPSILYKCRKHKSSATRKVSIEWIYEFLQMCNLLFFSFYSLPCFSTYTDISISFFKTTFTKLIVWWIGENQIGSKEVKYKIKEINKMIRTLDPFFNKCKAKGLQYKYAYSLISREKAGLLAFLSRIYVKVKRD